ncbi:MAG: hypothetical protein LBU14_05815 [Candidatus Peribacteria bacterium]|nr:hypothetical protein [Candidatus Peribacteria bacterium]
MTNHIIDVVPELFIVTHVVVFVSTKFDIRTHFVFSINIFVSRLLTSFTLFVSLAFLE